MIKLLYLEDDQSIYTQVRLILEEFPDIHVMHATCYRDAIALLGKANIVFSDCYGPGKEGWADDKFGLAGFDLLRDVRDLERRAGHVIPFAFASGEQFNDIIGRTQECGLTPLARDHFVHKPLNYSSVEEIVERLVREFREQPQEVPRVVPGRSEMQFVMAS